MAKEKGSKEHREVGFLYFNTYKYPNSPERLLSSIEEVVKKVLETMPVTYPVTEFENSLASCSDTDYWYLYKWSTIAKLEKNLTDCWNEEYFRNYWANALVREYSFMIWNIVFPAVQKEKGEHPAHKLAEETLAAFLKKYY